MLRWEGEELASCTRGSPQGVRCGAGAHLSPPGGDHTQGLAGV